MQAKSLAERYGVLALGREANERMRAHDGVAGGAVAPLHELL